MISKVVKANHTMKKVAIIQSSYIPWKGFFDLINSVDEFVIFDDAQYTRRDWRNRNRIRCHNNAILWLTIPVQVKGKFSQKIKDCRVADQRWADRHWNTILRCYSRARCFHQIAPWLYEIYRQCRRFTHLSEINSLFIKEILRHLGSKTRVVWSMDYEIAGNATEKLLNICLQAEAAEYVSGPKARNYLDEKLFLENGIGVSWMDYTGYPEYCQRFSPPFIHEVTILDLLLNMGWEGTRDHMLTFK